MAVKRNKVLIHVTTWMNLEHIMLREKKPVTKDCTYCRTPFIWNVQNRKIYRDRKQVAQGWSKGMGGHGMMTDRVSFGGKGDGMFYS